MKSPNKKSGFTLIELMVIIAIIGILSTIILTFLSSARNKTKDANVKRELNHLKTQANLNLPTGEVAVSCNAGVFLNHLIKPLLDAISTNKLCAHSNGQDFIVIAGLPSDSAKSWCVDSKNNSKQITTVNSLPADYTCP